MKILLISGEFPPIKTGDANHAFYTAVHLARRGHDVHVLTSDVRDVYRHSGFQVYPVMRGWSRADLPALKRVAARCAPDAVLQLFVGRMYGNRVMMTFAPTIIKSVLPAARFVTQFEWVGDMKNWHQSLGERFIRKLMAHRAGPGVDYEYGTLLRDSDHIIVLSDNHRERLVAGHADVQDKITLVPPGPLLTFSKQGAEEAQRQGRSLLGVRSDEFLFLNYGYILPFKGLETLLEAFQRVAERHPNARLALVGGFGEKTLHENIIARSSEEPSYAERIQSLPTRLGIAERVIWAGPFPTGDDRASLCLRAADVGILPFDDGVRLNRSSLAAVAAHGLPTITTQCPYLERQFVDRENVFLCPPRDTAALAAAMETVMTDSKIRTDLALGIQRFAEEWFSWEKVLDLTLGALSAPQYLATTSNCV